MKLPQFLLLLSIFIALPSFAQQSQAPPTETIKTAGNPTPDQQAVIDLSNTKWDWMAHKNVDSLETLFDDKAMFTHMGGTWGKTQELSTIKSGGIWYKKAFVYAVDARIFGDTAILLEDMDLRAVVGTHEVTNPFMVTEVYSKNNGKWKLDQLTFSHLLRTVKVESEKHQSSRSAGAYLRRNTAQLSDECVDVCDDSGLMRNRRVIYQRPRFI